MKIRHIKKVRRIMLKIKAIKCTKSHIESKINIVNKNNGVIYIDLNHVITCRLLFIHTFDVYCGIFNLVFEIIDKT